MPQGPEWVTIALLGKPRGNKGELQATSMSDSPGRFEKLSRVYLFRGDASLGEFPVETAWWHDRKLVLKFGSIDSISAAEPLAYAEVRVPFAERAPLEEGVHYQSDLVGCELVDERSGQPLGRVTDWEDTGGPMLMEIDGDWLVPFTPAICKQVDLAERRILVQLPDGLKELNKK
jgi:16S rRNA processing protein RimM